MSRIVKLFFFCFFLFVSSYSYSVEEKIVYLNLDYIYQKSIPGKLILEELNKNRKLNIEKFKEKESEIRATEQDLIKKKNILSKEEFDLKVRTLNEEMQKYNKSREKAFLEFDENKKKN